MVKKVFCKLNELHIRSGVFSSNTCNTIALNQALLAVGYDTDAKGGDYWILRNSWGTSWGEKGYVRLARNKNNMCGVTNYVFGVVTDIPI